MDLEPAKLVFDHRIGTENRTAVGNGRRCHAVFHDDGIQGLLRLRHDITAKISEDDTLLLYSSTARSGEIIRVSIAFQGPLFGLWINGALAAGADLVAMRSFCRTEQPRQAGRGWEGHRWSDALAAQLLTPPLAGEPGVGGLRVVG